MALSVTNESKPSTHLVPSLDFAFTDDAGDNSDSSKNEQEVHCRLYDPESTLEISRELADGFLILLSGGHNSASIVEKQKKIKREKKRSRKYLVGESASQDPEIIVGAKNEMSPEDLSLLQLAFAALTEGNVIDATFGVESLGGIKRSKGTSVHAYNASKVAKSSLLDASQSSEIIDKIAVQTYAKCFEIVIDYHITLEGLGFITWCVKHQKVRDDAEKRLEEAFSQLNEAMKATI